MIDFIGIGAHKAATTWLFHHLSSHPEINFPAGKGTHFWNDHLDRGEDWWASLFAHGAPGVKQGEITPAYAFLASHVIERIQRHAPEVRLIYSIRNPIDRAWAHTRYAAAQHGVDLDGATDDVVIEHFNSHGSVARSAHLDNLTRWRDVFGQDQIHMIFFDDIVSEPHAVLRKLSNRLDIDAKFFDSDVHLNEKVLQGPSVRLRENLKEYLVGMYRADILELEKDSGRDLSHWLN